MNDSLFRTILEYYALFWITFTPLGVLSLLFVNKRTGILKKLNDAIDRFVGIKPETEPKDENKNEKESDTLKKEIQDIKSGITNLTMQVGECYHCRLGSQNKDEKMYEITWYSENNFIGENEKDSTLFKAAHCGKVKVFAKRKDTVFEDGAQIYNITVLPKDKSWSGERLHEAVLNKAKLTDILLKMAGHKIIRSVPGAGVFVFKENGPAVQNAFQFNVLKECVRGTVVFKKPGEKLREEIINGLDERYIRIETKGDIDFWIHQVINVEVEEVDAYAFLRRGPEDTLILGIGENWREYGETEEFLVNIGMAEKIFEDCMDRIKPVEVEAVMNQKTSEEKPKKDKPAKTGTKEMETPSEPVQEDTKEKKPEKVEEKEPEKPNPEPEPKKNTESSPKPEQKGDTGNSSEEKHETGESAVTAESGKEPDSTAQEENKQAEESSPGPETEVPSDEDIPDIGTPEEPEEQEENSGEEYTSEEQVLDEFDIDSSTLNQFPDMIDNEY